MWVRILQGCQRAGVGPSSIDIADDVIAHHKRRPEVHRARLRTILGSAPRSRHDCPTTPPAFVAGGAVFRLVGKGRWTKPADLYDPVSSVEG